MIVKGKKIRVKCPFCAEALLEINRKTLTQRWLEYECPRCKEKFHVQKGWKERLQGVYNTAYNTTSAQRRNKVI